LIEGTEAGLTREDYAAIAAFRLELRRFLAFSEAAAARADLPTQQHQALLAIAGHDGPPTIGFVAEQLLVAPNTAAELVSRMVEAGLVEKTAAAADRRRSALTLTDKALALLQRLTAVHLAELRTLEPTLAQALARLRDPKPVPDDPSRPRGDRA
jgi:DNA-binding MarR family transcriptional regulator